jgi:hypothetical protein
MSNKYNVNPQLEFLNTIYHDLDEYYNYPASYYINYKNK